MKLDNEPIVQDWHVNSPVFFATQGHRAVEGKSFPQHRFALVMLANKPTRGGRPPLPKTAERILEAFLPLQPNELTTAPGDVALTDSEKTELTGFYRHPPVIVEILLDNGELYWRQGEIKLRIVKVGEDRFQ
jgi:hypothetical protein